MREAAVSKPIGRNDPCSCGSGRKYKKCCMSKNRESAKRSAGRGFRFEPGSYGDLGSFVPSIACLKAVSEDEWQYHFVLVRPDHVYADEKDAVLVATADIEDAFKVKQAGGSDAELAFALKRSGYVSVENFKVVPPGEFRA